MTALAMTLVALAAPAPCDRACEHRAHVRHWKRTWRHAPARMRQHLQSISACESGHDDNAVSTGGEYRGRFQWDLSTWRAVGGRGDPVDAGHWEQLARAVRLYEARGSAPWPVCRYA